MRGASAVWQRKRRLRELEAAIAEAQEAQADLQRRLDLFEKIAEAAGADLDGAGQAAPEPAMPVPPALFAAASSPRRDDVSVWLDVDGREVIAVVGGDEGDPRAWWAAIRRLTAPPRPVS
jgi:hypothetical protein